MANARGSDVYTVYNRPPFINGILSAIKPNTISLPIFNRLVEESAIFDITTMLTDMTREKDVSGLVPNLAGTCADYKESFKLLTDIGHRQLLLISKMDREIQIEIFDTLLERDFSLRAVLVLDDIQKNVVAELTKIRESSSLAIALRDASEEALIDLYKSPKRLRSSIFDKAIQAVDRSILLKGKPRIAYPKLVVDGDVLEVWQYFHIPRVENVKLKGNYSKFSVGQILDAITPEYYYRESGKIDRFDPESPADFMGLLGKVGNAIPRLIIADIKRNQKINDLVMQEDAVARAMYELFTKYPMPD